MICANFYRDFGVDIFSLLFCVFVFDLGVWFLYIIVVFYSLCDVYAFC